MGDEDGVIDLHSMSAYLAEEMLAQDITKHVSYITEADIPDVFKVDGRIIRVTVEFVERSEQNSTGE